MWVDVAIYNTIEGLKMGLMEINSFSSAGLYDCNIKEVICNVEGVIKSEEEE